MPSRCTTCAGRGGPTARRSACAEGQRFQRVALPQLADEGRFAMLTLRLDGRPIAFHNWFVAGSSIYLHRNAFDAGLARYGPGLVALRRSLAAASELGARRVEYLGGAEQFKRDLADRFEPLHQGFGLARGVAGHAYVARAQLAIAVRKRLKRSRAAAPSLSVGRAPPAPQRPAFLRGTRGHPRLASSTRSTPTCSRSTASRRSSSARPRAASSCNSPTATASATVSTRPTPSSRARSRTTSRAGACTLHFDNLEEWAPEYVEAEQGRARPGAPARERDDSQPQHRHPRVLGRRARRAARRRQYAGQLRRRRPHALALRPALEPHADRDRVAHARRHVPRLARALAGRRPSTSPSATPARRRRAGRTGWSIPARSRPSRSSSPTGRRQRSASARSTT